MAGPGFDASYPSRFDPLTYIKSDGGVASLDGERVAVTFK